MKTTIQKIWDADPCNKEERLADFGKSVPDDTEVPFEWIISNCCLSDSLWCVRLWPEHMEVWKRYAIWCARQVSHLMKDKSLVEALDIAESFLDGEATKEELKNATAYAYDDAYAAAAYAAAYAAAAYAAAYAAAAYAYDDAYAYADAAAADADADAYDAMIRKQKDKLLQIAIAGEWIDD